MSSVLEHHNKTLKMVGTAKQMLSVEMYNYSLSKTLSLANRAKAGGIQVGD